MVARNKRLVALSLFAISLASQARVEAQALDLKGTFPELQSSTLQISFSVRVLAADDKAVWNVESTRLTIPGRSVRVRLDGDNVRIYLICTPYIQESGTVLLLAQGQIWLSEPPEEQVKYFSPFYSIPVSLGEKILFFPLGVPEGAEGKDYYNIEMQIQIVPYAKDAPPADAPPKAGATPEKG